MKFIHYALITLIALVFIFSCSGNNLNSDVPDNMLSRITSQMFPPPPLVHEDFVGRSGMLDKVIDEETEAVGQYTNIQHCNQVLSITALHVSKVFLSDLEPLAIDPGADIAIFKNIDTHETVVRKPRSANRVAKSSPKVGDPVFNSTYFAKIALVFKGTVIGYNRYGAALDSQGYPGSSGSPVFNAQGDYLGFMTAIQLDPRAGSVFSWMSSHKILLELLKELPCSTAW